MLSYQAQREDTLFVERYRKLICPTRSILTPSALSMFHCTTSLSSPPRPSAAASADQLFVLETLSSGCRRTSFLLVEGKSGPKFGDARQVFLRTPETSAKHLRRAEIETSTYDLIEKAELVATVTGTAGWEALCMGKPVLAMGTAWYRELPGAFHFSSDLDYEQVIRHLFSRERLKRASARCWRACRSEWWILPIPGPFKGFFRGGQCGCSGWFSDELSDGPSGYAAATGGGVAVVEAMSTCALERTLRELQHIRLC